MKLLVTLLLLISAHFALTANVPAPAGQAWLLWPFAANSQAVLGLTGTGIGNLTKILSGVAGICFLAALLALFGWLIPAEWWGVLVGIGALSSLILYLLYLGSGAILPIAIDLLLLWGVFIPHWSVANLSGA